MVKPSSDILRTIQEQVNPIHTALIIVDVQNDFVHPELGARAKGANLWMDAPLYPRMVEKLGTLLEEARKSNCLIIFLQDIEDSQYISDVYASHMQQSGSFGKLCQSGTYGADFYGDIRPTDSVKEITVTKHRYSGFSGTNLDLVLRSNNIRTVIVTGVVTSCCVESTARDAFLNDYYTVTAGDACADGDSNAHEATLSALAKYFGFVTTVDTLTEIWASNENFNNLSSITTLPRL